VTTPPATPMLDPHGRPLPGNVRTKGCCPKRPGK
jgi:hypothetical protein